MAPKRKYPGISEHILDVLEKAPVQGMYSCEIFEGLPDVYDTIQLKGSLYALKKYGHVDRSGKKTHKKGYRWLLVFRKKWPSDPVNIVLNAWYKELWKINGKRRIKS